MLAFVSVLLLSSISAAAVNTDENTWLAEYKVLVDTLFFVDTCNLTSSNKSLNISHVEGNSCNVTQLHNDCGNISITCYNVGQTIITFDDFDEKIRVVSIHEQGTWQKVFIIGVAVLLFIALFTMGCKLSLLELYEHIRHPTNALIGICCQFILMPVAAFGLAKAAASEPNNTFYQLGIFACGIAPGGGASNIYTEIFEGNIQLSVVMTFVSTVAAFATVPFWLATLGRKLSTSYAYRLPLKRIATSLVTLLVPIAFGIMVKYFFEKTAERIAKTIKIFGLIFLMFVIIVGFISYSYIFNDLQWKVVLVSVFLPWIGFITGSLIAVVLKRSQKDIIAVCLETGIQNTGIAIYILDQTLDEPFSSLSLVCPIFVALSTPIPIITCLSLRMILEKCRRNRKIGSGEIVVP